MLVSWRRCCVALTSKECWEHMAVCHCMRWHAFVRQVVYADVPSAQHLQFSPAELWASPPKSLLHLQVALLAAR